MKKIVRFTASWCAPCKMLAKNLEEANLQFPIEVVDIDVNSDTAIEYGVRGIPTLIMFDDDGNVSKRTTGLQSVEALKEWANG